MSLYTQALQRFYTLMQQAKQLPLTYPNAMTVATADANGKPSARIILLKDADEQGFVFYTNFQSRKGDDLTANPQAALLFYWEALKTQVRVEGTVEVVSDAEADAYWRTRPLESRIGAWASQQSQPIENRKVLEDRYEHFAHQFADSNIPRPPHWSGYRLTPQLIEFWEERPFRLHERVCYVKKDGQWSVSLLNP
jgi:pyridoxamine 5'-phosphate oxidase